ncbi:MAG: heavy-metal-associated domain-containing protein [Nitrospirae bacterium]|nr:heavy-metal-associated domain-containing protein [Nitrospirota bacterium]
MAEINLKIEGMSCGHCVMAVKKALDNLAGVTSSEVAIGSAKVAYDGTKTDREKIEDAVRKAGYQIV